MPRSIKRNPATLVMGSVWMLAMHLVDIHWLVMPPLHESGLSIRPLDLTALAAAVGLFVAGFGWLLRAHPLVPVGDPRLPESLGFENV